jgi:hypothetical protein
MKFLKVLWSVISTALSLYLIYALGYWWVWAGGLLAGVTLGIAAGIAITKEFKT